MCIIQWIRYLPWNVPHLMTRKAQHYESIGMCHLTRRWVWMWDRQLIMSLARVDFSVGKEEQRAFSCLTTKTQWNTLGEKSGRWLMGKCVCISPLADDFSFWIISFEQMTCFPRALEESRQIQMRRKCKAKAPTNLLISVPHSSDRENSCQVFNP